MPKKNSRDTKIICTLGPASSKAEVLAQMASAGMNIARLNFSHGNHSTHQEMINLIRSVNKRYGHDIKILQDLEGYRIRIGRYEDPKKLVKGAIFYMSNETSVVSDFIPFDYDESVKKIKTGSDIFIDDGQIHLKVVGHTKGMVKVRVIVGGLLKQRKGVNIPQLKLRADIMTAKDKKDLLFGLKNKVDYVAQSFVRNKEDIGRVVKVVRSKLLKCKVIAKIENREGVDNVNGIMEACDGIMVARGDLGVTLPIFKIPIIQKYIIRRCNRNKRFVVTATQMLENMTEHARPTRAEVSDVANAILDGTDCVMLSGETAVGKHPVKTVRMMSQIIDFTEHYQDPRF